MFRLKREALRISCLRCERCWCLSCTPVEGCISSSFYYHFYRLDSGFSVENGSGSSVRHGLGGSLGGAVVEALAPGRSAPRRPRRGWKRARTLESYERSLCSADLPPPYHLFREVRDGRSLLPAGSYIGFLVHSIGPRSRHHYCCSYPLAAAVVGVQGDTLPTPRYTYIRWGRAIKPVFPFSTGLSGRARAARCHDDAISFPHVLRRVSRRFHAASLVPVGTQ